MMGISVYIYKNLAYHTWDDIGKYHNVKNMNAKMSCMIYGEDGTEDWKGIVTVSLDNGATWLSWKTIEIEAPHTSIKVPLLFATTGITNIAVRPFSNFNPVNMLIVEYYYPGTQ